MKREIKFRVWIKSQQYMDFPTSITIDDSGHVEGVRGYGGEYPYTDIEFMQYTGLKDKNGVEICEGDLLRVERDDNPDSYYVAPVTWGGADYPAFDIPWKYIPNNIEYDSNILATIWAGESEEVMSVIGNIYENPELLEALK